MEIDKKKFLERNLMLKKLNQKVLFQIQKILLTIKEVIKSKIVFLIIQDQNYINQIKLIKKDQYKVH